MNDTKGHTARIGFNFSKEIELIKDRRLESGMDKRRKSTRKLTEIIIKHDAWESMREDMIELNFKRLKNEQ